VEQKRPDVARARDVWISRRQPFMRNMLTRIGFIDETSLKTNMAKTTGWSPCGARLVDHVPFGHWQTQTPDQVRGKLFIAALRHDRLDAPWVIGGPINRELFDLYIETQLAPTLHKGDVVILDNLATHRSPKAAAILKDIGAWFLFLPPYSPDLNPIEMAFAKLKALIRKAAARTYDQLWKAVGQVCDLFKEEECYNFFKAAGYETE
jgi:transposase